VAEQDTGVAAGAGTHSLGGLDLEFGALLQGKGPAGSKKLVWLMKYPAARKQISNTQKG